MFETLPRASSALELSPYVVYHVVCHTVRHEQPLPVSLPLSRRFQPVWVPFWAECLDPLCRLWPMILSGRHHQSILAFAQGHKAELRCGSWMIDQPCWLTRKPLPATGRVGDVHTWATTKSHILSRAVDLWSWVQVVSCVYVNSMVEARAPLFHLYVNLCWKTCKEQNWNKKFPSSRCYKKDCSRHLYTLFGVPNWLFS